MSSKGVAGKREREVLRMIADGACQGMGYILDCILDKQRSRSEKLSLNRALKSVESKGLIVLSGDVVRLSKKGQKLLKALDIEGIIIEKSVKWDRVWRVISYDIPEKQKKEREYFRKKMKELGFTKLQKSMWVIPYECKEEVAVFAQLLGVASHVMYLLTDKLPDQDKFIREFGLK